MRCFTSPITKEKLLSAFQQLLQESWEYRLREHPLFATFSGDRRYNDRLPSMTLADISRRQSATRSFHERLLAIDLTQLSLQEQIDYDVFARMLEDDIADYQFRSYLMPVTNRQGFHIYFAEMAEHMPLQNLQDYENYIARLRGFYVYACQHIELMREGMRQGYTVPQITLVNYDQAITAQTPENPEASALFKPFKTFPKTITEADQPRLREAGLAALQNSVFPGYRQLLAFMEKEYVPAARSGIALSDLPNGGDYYRFMVRHHTTLDVTPEQVHDVGMAEVRRIRQEMQEVLRKVEFKGDFPEFLQFLRSDPRFYVTEPQQLLKEVSLILKRMDGELPQMFRMLPRTPYGIKQIPAYIAPQMPTAYYMPPPGDGSRAGFYYVNTHNLASRPLYEMEALSLHEAVPGHHLQIALQHELKDLPPFRRFAGFSAFVEGWALYCERLGLELGFYQDPYSDFGRLTYEMWRACRLVVDTGMHCLHWTRQQSIDFMAANTALTLPNINTEVDRYIAWPGQALAYKMGELKIRELRRYAEEKLAERFDIRDFHDVLLQGGALPLPIVETKVRAYVERQKSR